MKAEHRKELETNVLADRMGKLVQKMKTRPQRRSVMYVILALVVIAVGIIFYRLQVGSRQQVAMDWRKINDGSQTYVEEVARIGWVNAPGRGKRLTLIEPPTTNAAKGARLTAAHHYAWEKGVRRIGQDPISALSYLGIAENLYDSVLKEVEGDPDFEPECRYNLAVIEESRAVQNQDRLKSAQTKFQEVADKFPQSGYGQLAKKRADDLKDRHAEYQGIYKEMQRRFFIPDEKIFSDKLIDPKLPPPAP